MRCSFVRPCLARTSLLRPRGAGLPGQRTSGSSSCSTYCRDSVLALAALHPSPLASSDFISTRALLTDRLLDLGDTVKDQTRRSSYRLPGPLVADSRASDAVDSEAITPRTRRRACRCRITFEDVPASAATAKCENEPPVEAKPQLPASPGGVTVEECRCHQSLARTGHRSRPERGAPGTGPSGRYVP